VVQKPIKFVRQWREVGYPRCVLSGKDGHNGILAWVISQHLVEKAQEQYDEVTGQEDWRKKSAKISLISRIF
jgi:hypothetical protein